MRCSAFREQCRIFLMATNSGCSHARRASFASRMKPVSYYTKILTWTGKARRLARRCKPATRAGCKRHIVIDEGWRLQSTPPNPLQWWQSICSVIIPLNQNLQTQRLIKIIVRDNLYICTKNMNGEIFVLQDILSPDSFAAWFHIGRDIIAARFFCSRFWVQRDFVMARLYAAWLCAAWFWARDFVAAWFCAAWFCAAWFFHVAPPVKRSSVLQYSNVSQILWQVLIVSKDFIFKKCHNCLNSICAYEMPL